MLVVHLLDASSQPLAGMTVCLVLNRYGEAIEAIPFGSCVTDEKGSCAFTVNNPPRLRSGRIEGFIDLGAYGRQLIGWKGDRYEITLQLYPDGKLATAPAPLDGPYEGQTQQPTDAPLSAPTRATLAVLTPTGTYTPRFTPAVATSLTPQATVTIFVSATPTPQPAAGPTAIHTPALASPKAQPSGGVWAGLALFAGLGAACAVYYLGQRKHRQSG